MPIINWDENKPAGQDSLGIGDDQIRSDKSAIRTAIDAEHVFPSTGGDAGVHRFGSARPYYGAQSLVSSTGSDGRLMATSDTSRLFGVGSGGTVFYGGATVLSAGSFPGTTPQRFYWAVEFGAVQSSTTTTTVTFDNSGFSGVPFTTVSAVTTRTNPITVHMATISQAGFTARCWLADTGSTTSNVTIMYHSIGTRVL